MKTGVIVEVCTDEARFAELAPDWRRLHSRCRTATPFQSHAWLHSWWLSYGMPGRLRVHVVYRDGELIGAAPLMRVLRPLPALVPLGGTISDFADVLLDDSCAQEAADALTGALMSSARGALIDLGEVRPGGGAERLHANWPGQRRQLADSRCLELPAEGMDVLLGRLLQPRPAGPRQAPEDRRAGHRAARRAARGGAGRAAYAARPARAPVAGARGDARAPAQPVRGAPGARGGRDDPAGRGGGHRVPARRGGGCGRPHPALPALVSGYLYGAHPGLRGRKVDVATMLLRSCAQRIDGSGRAALSMLRGNEPYKQHWRPEVRVNQRFLLARRRTAPLLWASALHARLRRRAGAALRSLRQWRDGRSRPAPEPSGPA